MALVNRVLNRNPQSIDDLLPDMVKWIDNSDETAWYYLDIQEASNSHDYERRLNHSEFWTDLRENPDWTAYEN